MWTPGQSIDNHFKLERILGQGGFGVTFLARDTRQNPPVYCVIKTLKKELPDFQTQQAKFRQEALNLAKCSHPHVVAVQDVICHEGIWGLVMDYIDGDTLSTIVRSHPDEKLSENDSLQYIDQIGQALECVHDRGLLHRDIKPLNIMVRQDTNKAILIDFGLARDFVFDDSRSMTAMMSEGFAPIEQYERRGKFGPSTDVYALAATLYCMLTGEAPLFNAKGRKQAFDGGKPIDDFMWDKLKALGVSDRIQKAIISGMAISPEDRPQSMREWRETLGLVGRSIPQGVQFESSARSLGSVQKEVPNLPSIKETKDFIELPEKIHLNTKNSIRLKIKRLFSFLFDLMFNIASSVLLINLIGSTITYALTALICCCFILFYFIYFETADSHKGTFGKRIFKLSVVNRNGRKLNVFQSILRLVLTMFFVSSSFVYGIGLINIIVGLFRKDGRCLNDLWSETMVVDKNG
jgi:serine/threonine protein kinase